MSKDDASLSLKICRWSALCGGFDSLITEFSFVVQGGLPTDVVFGSDWCAYRREAADHHNVSLPLSELVVSDGDSNGSSVSVSSDVSQAGSSMDVDATQAGSFANMCTGDATKIREVLSLLVGGRSIFSLDLLCISSLKSWLQASGVG
ncbi:hypothetical protein AZE42_03961 [Rhizopogon vesiculosus]|uniref:Uncharacterized protein n=1 Tax=Rhizopogon vesiculosus TaxID=180088 RepID=A0A1J8PR66_9AGAM|nr:hypothetical protein AZE42_03961 [Rhizopogon vesiculosus]